MSTYRTTGRHYGALFTVEFLGSQRFQFMKSILKLILSQKVFNQTGCHNLDSHGICHLIYRSLLMHQTEYSLASREWQRNLIVLYFGFNGALSLWLPSELRILIYPVGIIVICNNRKSIWLYYWRRYSKATKVRPNLNEFGSRWF